MDKPILNILSAIAAAIIVIAAMVAPYHYYKFIRPELLEMQYIKSTVDSLQTIVTSMQQVDTLILNMSEYNAKNIEMMEENHLLMNNRISATEYEIREINRDLDAYD